MEIFLADLTPIIRFASFGLDDMAAKRGKRVNNAIGFTAENRVCNYEESPGYALWKEKDDAYNKAWDLAHEGMPSPPAVEDLRWDNPIGHLHHMLKKEPTTFSDDGYFKLWVFAPFVAAAPLLLCTGLNFFRSPARRSLLCKVQSYYWPKVYDESVRHALHPWLASPCSAPVACFAMLCTTVLMACA